MTKTDERIDEIKSSFLQRLESQRETEPLELPKWGPDGESQWGPHDEDIKAHAYAAFLKRVGWGLLILSIAVALRHLGWHF